MKVFTSTIRLSTDVKTGEVNITDQVEAIIKESQVEEGALLLFTGHTTAAVHLNNLDRDLETDFHDVLNELVPTSEKYHHNKGDYGKNADAHIKSVLVGNSVSIPISKGRLALGQWQAIYFSEFDGPRKRLVSVKITGI